MEGLTLSELWVERDSRVPERHGSLGDTYRSEASYFGGEGCVTGVAGTTCGCHTQLSRSTDES